MRRTPVTVAGILAAALALASPLAAQDTAPPTHVSLNAGLFQFDLSGTGLAPMAAFRAATPISTVLMFEGALSAALPGQDIGRTLFLIPEGQVQLALPFERVVPYLGLGAGAAIDFRDAEFGGTQLDLTISGSLGIKTWLNETMGAQLEFRARGVDPEFTGSSSEYTIGLIWRV